MTLSESETILRQVKDLLTVEFHITHTTIQFENGDCEIAHGCVIPIGVPSMPEPLKARR
jgi:cobalt-zinc-cadmium efflux system protein